MCIRDSLYATLGVGRHATTDEVEAAFAAWQARADGGEAFADEVWQRVRYAHEVLSNPCLLYTSRCV